MSTNEPYSSPTTELPKESPGDASPHNMAEIESGAGFDENHTAAVDVQSPLSPGHAVFDPNFDFPEPEKPPTRRFFNWTHAPWWRFPDPIDGRQVRVHSLFIFLITMMMLITNAEICPRYYKEDITGCKDKSFWWSPVMLVDFLLRSTFGPTPFSPFGLMSTGILYLFNVPPILEGSAPKRFAFVLGVIVNCVITTLWFIIRTHGTMEFAGRPLLILCVFAGMESILGFCVGCWFFKTFFKLRDEWHLRHDYDRLRIHHNEAHHILAPTVDGPADDLTHKYDVDLIVIGAGSGGLAMAKEAARLKKKVVLLDYVNPTPHGTTWGVGGTCVNVGCIPKKLFHQTALVGHKMKHDAMYYGWKLEHHDMPKPQKYDCDWETVRANVQHHIKNLNEGYLQGFKNSHVQYVNAFGSFVDEHTVRCCHGDGRKCEDITARRIVVAVGGRPKRSGCPGDELCITSDDMFSLQKAPGKTLIVGASYIALECAGFISGMGMEAHVMVRSKVLRGFDGDMADKIVENMKLEGTQFIPAGFVPCKFVKEGDKIRCFAKCANPGKCNHTEEHCYQDTYDTVLLAMGREPNVDKISLENTNVKLNPKSGKIFHYHERTTVEHIYALGDCADPGIELTPVAIKQGLMLAQRLYARGETNTHFNIYPTTVFTPVEYGCIGVSEERANEVFGEDNIEVYHSEFTPLEYFLPHTKYTCYTKLIVNYLDNERVIGFHYLGPNAGEVTQGFAAAFVAGFTKSQFDAIIGIHPTCAEEMVTLRRTKKSGIDPKKTGC